MSEAPETQVLIAGAGPIGMTAADPAELVVHLGATFALPEGGVTG